MRGLIIFLCIFATITPKSNSQYLFPIVKDEPTNQFFTIVFIGTTKISPVNLLLDLGTDLTWLNCRNLTSLSSIREVPCQSSNCISLPNNECNNRKSCFTWQQNPFEPNFFVTCHLVQDTASIITKDTSETGSLVPFRPFTFSCATEKSIHGLASFVDGVLSLSPGDLSITKQVTSSLNLTSKFALCLPSSSSSPGLLYISEVTYLTPPFNESTNPIPLRLTRIRGIDSGDYLIDVESIYVDGTPLSLNPNFLSHGAKLSTVVPYTLLHTNIYISLAHSFTLKAKEMGISRVPPVAPFKDCFDASSVGNRSTGPNVPKIDFAVRGMTFELLKWQFYGANTMVKLNEMVMCLAFIDGGKEQKEFMVIGTHQIQDYLLEFDINRTMLGFSESLLLYNASCSQI